MIEYKVSQRPPQVDIVEWEKTYKEHLKKKDNERMVKAQTRNKKYDFCSFFPLFLQIFQCCIMY